LIVVTERAKMNLKSTRQINEEWKTLPSAPSQDNTKRCYATALCNRNLNRYQDVLPFEGTRVKFEDSNNYINASYIEICPEYRCIAAQAPLPQSFDDFWRMVWENHVSVIVMLARFVEKRKVKAHCYWPSEIGSSENFNGITVSLEKKQQLTEGITIHHFLISNGSETRKLGHLHYTDWPDFGVPMSTDGIRELKRTAELFVERESTIADGMKKTYPILVHCSAGIGRAGTFLAYLNYCHKVMQGVSHDELSVANIVSNLRTQRMCMVQTKEQFRFIYQLLEDEFNEVPYDVTSSTSSPQRPLRRKTNKPPLRSVRSYCTPRTFLRSTQNGVSTLSISTA